MRPIDESERDDDLVAALIRTAGTRAEPPAGLYERVLAAAEGELETQLRTRRRRRLAGWLAAAAAVLAIGVGVRVNAPAPPAIEVATVQRTLGAVEARAAGARGSFRAAPAGTPLLAGSGVRTPPGGGAGLMLAGGVSLRLAERTEVELLSEDHLRLLRGTVYADTGAETGPPIAIETTAGTVRDFGTQFELRLAEATLRLRVREGAVILERGSERFVADQGEELRLAADGRLSRGAIAPGSPEWRWVEALAPSPVIDGQPVSVLLEWVGRETGRPLRYRDEAARTQAARAILHGRLRDMTPLEALDVMLATTDLGYVLEDSGTIEVHQK